MDDAYRRLARHLDSLPNGYPSSEDGAELRILAKLFTPEEADLAARLRRTPEIPARIAARIGADPEPLAAQLKGMARRGLIAITRTPEGLAYGALPFVVGIYENMVGELDAEFAQLFEDYYRHAFGRAMAIAPSVHRVIPVQESVRTGMEIHPFESAASILGSAHAWGVFDCICRKQKALIGDPCGHPIDVCLTFNDKPGAYDHHPVIRGISLEEALNTLHRASEAGLVHTVSNSREGVSYVCSCCTCSCGILRGMADLGLANVVARSAFVNQVDEERCVGCELCLDLCQFDALFLDQVAQVDVARCVGCGVCVSSCPENALGLARRPEAEILPPPADPREWQIQRLTARGLPVEDLP
jgi:formate hydrogenlyase subunit 6/NADH:ubiquinone oxidoreductase subunit I